MTLSRRLLLGIFTGASAGAVLPRGLLAAGYPARPIQLVVPFAAGGNADIVGRLVGDQIGKGLNGTVVVENRNGAGGSVGAEYVARATPDGYTLLVGSNGPLTVNPFLHAQLGYDPLKDFAPVALTSYVPHVLILSNDVAAKTVAEFVAASKTTPMTIDDQRRRQRDAHDIGALQGGDGRKHHARALSRRRRVAPGPDGRQCQRRDDRILNRAAAAQRQEGAHPCGRGRAPLEARSRHPDVR